MCKAEVRAQVPHNAWKMSQSAPCLPIKTTFAQTLSVSDADASHVCMVHECMVAHVHDADETQLGGRGEGGSFAVLSYSEFDSELLQVHAPFLEPGREEERGWEGGADLDVLPNLRFRRASLAPGGHIYDAHSLTLNGLAGCHAASILPSEHQKNYCLHSDASRC